MTFNFIHLSIFITVITCDCLPGVSYSFIVTVVCVVVDVFLLLLWQINCCLETNKGLGLDLELISPIPNRTNENILQKIKLIPMMSKKNQKAVFFQG